MGARLAAYVRSVRPGVSLKREEAQSYENRKGRCGADILLAAGAKLGREKNSCRNALISPTCGRVIRNMDSASA